jgi:squalene cyclase
VFRLLGLKYAQAMPKEIQDAVAALLKIQRGDGGWGQLDKFQSDAYATGSALVILHQAGGLPVSAPSYQRGLDFLVRDQKPDGSWLVHSRSRPFQAYFETGFPYGKDQWISSAASGWAAAALALACPVPGETSTNKKLPAR